MSASTTNHWKLGAFVVAGLALAVAALLWIGEARFDREIMRCRAYFKESVNGLEVGSPVKLRGVTIGSVSRIGFAPNGRAVEVVLDAYVDSMRRLGLQTDGDDFPSSVHDDIAGIYAQLASSGITGNKYILVDFVEEGEEITSMYRFDFELGADVVPTAPSSLESLEQLLIHAAETLPETLTDLRGMAAKTRELIDGIELQPTLASVEEMAATIRDQASQLDVAGLEAEVDATLAEARATLTELRGVAGVVGERREALGTMLDDLASVAHTLDAELGAARLSDTTASLREAGGALTGVAAEADALTRDARRLLEDVDDSARELRSTLVALRQLVDLLERNPSALLRGRVDSEPPPRNP